MGETQEICNILAADDEDYTLELYRDVLENRVETQGDTKRVYRLYTATRGDEALELFKRESQNSRFCVVFLDINMPSGPDGVWVAQQIREVDKDVNIVLVTGFAGLDLEEISSKIPPLDKLLYLQKPFHIQEILQLASALSAKWFA
ncbi:MAG: two-component system response regulator, partial [Desulfatiglandales bacterium]